mmetsp:Transcript_44450/g.142886  ORF Transcript_44450/g.142886 Transcript_44450/m.142886 type:complete len:215 (-) Transcript_44450:31-675(-)
MHAAMAGLVLVRNELRQLCMVDATVEGVGEQRAVLQVPHHLAGRGGEEQAEADEQPAEEVVVRLAGDQHKVRQLAKRVRDADERGGEVGGGNEEVQRVEERDVDADPGQRVEQAEGEQRRREQPQKHGPSAQQQRHPQEGEDDGEGATDQQRGELQLVEQRARRDGAPRDGDEDADAGEAIPHAGQQDEGLLCPRARLQVLSLLAPPRLPARRH